MIYKAEDQNMTISLEILKLTKMILVIYSGCRLLIKLESVVTKLMLLSLIYPYGPIRRLRVEKLN